ncbi:MAG: ATP-binding protein [bacterium]
MNIPIENYLQFVSSFFDDAIVLDDKDSVLYISPGLAQACQLMSVDLNSIQLNSILSKESLEDFQKIKTLPDQDKKEYQVVFENKEMTFSKMMHVSHFSMPQGNIVIFWRCSLLSRSGSLTQKGVNEIERAKELACLYAVTDWIQTSKTVDEFFSGLPQYIKGGMQYPNHVMVYSQYRDIDYGEKPKSKEYIQSSIVVREDTHGFIVVGYDRPELGMLKEEQQMLDEITQILGLTLDRKELRENLSLKVGEVDELEQEINKRSQALEDQRTKLETVNKYIDFIQRDFDDTKNRIATVFQAIPDLMAIIDLKRNVIMTNHEKVQPGNKCYKTFFNGESPCVDCRLKKVIKEKAPITLEIKHEDIYYEVHALPIFNKENEVEGILEFYRDISYKKNFEKQLQQADKLASLGQLVSGIGHEINNPNQFIRGNISIIRQAMEDILPILDKHAKDNPGLKIARLKYPFFRENVMILVDDMCNGSERIKRIVQDLKSFARKDDGLLIDTVDINTVISESARLVHNQVQSAASIELNLEPALPVLTGNAQKIEQVIINLIINASQAMSEEKRGLIKISTSFEELHVIVKVEDNGKGMPERTLESIFDPFFTTKRAKGGTGLGLSIAYRIIEEHQGSISVTSKLGEGSVFTIKIPQNTKKDQTSTLGYETGEKK